MATIEEAVTAGIDRAEAEKLLSYGQSVLNAAVKERNKQKSDPLTEFKEKYADAYTAAEIAITTLKQSFDTFLKDHPDTKLQFNTEFVKSTKRGSSRRGTGKSRDSIDIAVLAQHYAGSTLSYNSEEAELQANGKVKAGAAVYDNPNAWMQAIKPAGTRAGIWSNVIKIDTGNGESISMTKAYNSKKTAVEPPTVSATNDKKK